MAEQAELVRRPAPPERTEPAARARAADSRHDGLARRREVRIDLNRARMLNAKPSVVAQRAAAARLAGRQAGSMPAAGPDRGVIQLASKLLVVGGKKDRKELEKSTKREATEFGLPATLLADASLNDVGEKDQIYLTGAHGSESDYAMFKSGAELAQALWDKGLRTCRGIVITGCNTGGGFSNQFRAAADKMGIKITEYVTAPKTEASTPSGRFVADTPDQAEYLRLKEVAKDAKASAQARAQAAEGVKKFESMDYVKEVQNPVHLLDDMIENLDSLDRHYEGGELTRQQYLEQFERYRRAELARIQLANQVWTTSTKPAVGQRLKLAVARKPVGLSLADLWGLGNSASQPSVQDKKDQKEKGPPPKPASANAAQSPSLSSAAPIHVQPHGSASSAASSSSSSQALVGPASQSPAAQAPAAAPAAAPPIVAVPQPNPLDQMIAASIAALPQPKPPAKPKSASNAPM